MAHSVNVSCLPPGPIWLLHSFSLVTTAIMPVWYLRYEWRPAVPRLGRAPQYPAKIPRSGQEPARSSP